MDEDVEKVMVPFEEDGVKDGTPALVMDGSLALSSADAASAKGAAEAERLDDYAQSWGIMIPADFTPATKAQVAYWRELCGAISLTGAEGLRDGDMSVLRRAVRWLAARLVLTPFWPKP